MANGGGTEIERLHATVGVDLSELRAGLASAQTETRTATAGMAGSFDAAATKIDGASKKIEKGAAGAGRGAGMLGIQIGQASQQLMGGASAAMVFAQQMPDVAFALQGSTGAAGRFAAFMMGPWGVALTLGASLVGLLASSLWDASDAKDEATAAAKALKEAEERLANATAAANHQTRQGILDDIARANSLRQREIQTRRTLQAELELARQRAVDTARAAQMQTADGAGGGAARAGLRALQGGFEATARDIERRIAEQDAKIARAGTAIQAGRRQIADRDIAAATDPTTAANQRLEDATDRYARAFDAGRITIDQYRDAVLRETRARDAAVESIQEGNRAERGGRATQRRAEAEARKAERERERAANEAYREQRAFNRALGSAESGLLSAQMQVATTFAERAELERQAAQQRHDQTEEEVLLNRDYTDAQKGRLLAINAEVLALQHRKITLDEIARAEESELRAIRDAAELDEIRRGTARDLLSQQFDLARTMADRRAIALQIVRLDHDLAMARQQEIMASAMRVLASEAATEAEKEAARAAIERARVMMEGIEARLPGDIEIAKDRNRTVLDAEGFGRELGDTLEGGILEALKGQNLKDAMRDGIFNLLNDAMSDAFANLSKVLFGEQGLGGVLGGLLGGIFGGKSRAVGGPVLAGAAYNVGAGEKFVAPANGRILSREDAMAAAGGSGRPFNLNITISGARGNQEIMEMVRAGVQEGIGQYDRVVGDRVDNSFKRRA